MMLSRRHALRLSACLSLLAVGGCAGAPSPSARRNGRVVLLSPLSGPMASVGRDIEAAAMLALEGRAAAPALAPADSASGVAGGVLSGVDLVIGPLFRGEVAPALAAAGAAPVVTLSNDDTLAGGGAMVLGLTPAQSVAAILPYARRQGVRTVAVAATDDALGRAYAEAARTHAAGSGVSILPASLAGDAGGQAADAVLVAGPADALERLAAPFAADGVQLLGGVEWLGAGAAGRLSGGWFAGPDPAGFAPFADAFARRTGRQPGLLAGLAFDAAGMAAALAEAGALDRAGVLRAEGFAGAVGAFRFRPDGSAARDLSIFVAGPDGPRPVEKVRAT